MSHGCVDERCRYSSAALSCIVATIATRVCCSNSLPLKEGRLVCVAKGAKSAPKGRSALAAAAAAVSAALAGWVGRGEVKTLTRAEAASPSIALSGERLYCGFYLNELLLRLVDARMTPRGAVRLLSAGAWRIWREPMDAVLRRFELRLLEELGYALDLRFDRQGRPVDLAPILSLPATRGAGAGSRGERKHDPSEGIRDRRCVSV